MGAQETCEEITPWRFDTARHRSLELEYGAAAAAWLAELDHRLGLGGSLQSGREEPASGWNRFWK